uniref:hypothetical protein n=1 Tax=uncultured Altererythrobacter sp. TaxID=500840 RepID=UPI0026177B36|nr:hypothetical protein [uncultured Altererythrobacter sp.]
MLEFVLVLNAIWFGMGFRSFYLRRADFAKVIVTNPDHRQNTAYDCLVETGRFLGGFNFASCVLNILMVFNVGGFESGRQWAVLLIFNALAHASQFVGNIPIAMQNRQGGGAWQVFEFPMLRILVGDLVLAVLNAALAVWCLM